MQVWALFAQGLIGIALQWVMFGPKKIPNYLAWGVLAGLTVALWIWITPDATAQFSNDWRMAVASIVTFFLAAKGSGSGAKAIGIAPATDSK
jgi:hypothetical protein